MSQVPLVVTMVRAGGLGRAVLIVITTALTTGLLLVAVSIARLDGAAREVLFEPIADPGTRGGAIFAVALMTVPLLLLLDQAVRLGSSSRHRRYAALNVAGATRRDLRRFGAFEVGAPALAGSLLGVGVWGILRALLGQGALGDVGAMVPSQTGPGWWGVLVVAAVAAYGVVVGMRVGSRTAHLVRASRGMRPPPRPWSAGLLVLAAALLIVLPGASNVEGQLLAIPMLALTVAGLAGLAPWAAYQTASWLQPRATSAAMVLATRRLMADARPAGRAAAAVGAVAFAGGAAGAFTADLQAGYDGFEPARTASLAVVVTALLLATLTIAGTLAVHSTEVLLERRREMAALVATGVPEQVIVSSQRLESTLATMPMTVIGVLIGSLGYALASGGVTVLGFLIILGSIAATVAAVALATRLSVHLVRPWVHDAVQPQHLRTE